MQTVKKCPAVTLTITFYIRNIIWKMVWKSYIAASSLLLLVSFDIQWRDGVLSGETVQ